MQLILASFISIIIGGIAGYLFHKTRSHQLVVDKELLAKELELVKAQQKSWEQFHEESMKSAEAVMFKTSEQVANKLLDSHKRENEAAKKQAEEITKKETENLHKEFKTVVEKLAAIDGQNKNQDQKISAIWQGLISPVKAANFAEIGLENSLKLFGLEQGRDFITQTAIEGTRLKPDAVIHLPGGNVMMIDAKTSKFFVEESERLKDTMNKHLQSISTKDYAGALKSKDNLFVVNVMYLPTETALAKVLEADRDFAQKCMDNEVILATPSSLQLLLHIARHHISVSKQEQNHQLILDSLGKVVSSVDNLLRGLNEVGVAIRRSADAYSKLSGPVNSRVIPRIKNAIKLGLKPEKDVRMPDALPSFNIIENEANVVDLEAEAPENLRALEKKAS